MRLRLFTPLRAKITSSAQSPERQRYHATSVLSLTARHPARAGRLDFKRFIFGRPSGIKHFQAIQHSSVDVAHGLALLFGLGTRALSHLAEGADATDFVSRAAWHRPGSRFLRCSWGDRGRWGGEEHAEICYRSRTCGVHVNNIGWRRSVMHAVIRSYSGKGTKALFDLLEKNKGEVESLIRGVKGFVSYSLVRTTRGGFSSRRKPPPQIL